MKVFLINIAKKNLQIQLPIWLVVLVNALKLQGIEPNTIDLGTVPPDECEQLFLDKMSLEPAILGFNIMCGNDNLNIVEQLARKAKDSNPDHIIIYGGALPSSMPDLLIEKGVCDYVLVGEGEIAFPSFIKAVRQGNFFPKDISGICYKKADTVTKIPPKRVCSAGQQLGEISQPDYSLIDMEFYINYLKETNQSFSIMASRGCKGNCFFCNRIIKGLSVRQPTLVLSEIEYIINKYDLDSFYFVDENCLESKTFFYQFIKLKQNKNLNFTFRGQCRIDAIDEDVCALGRDNNLASVTVGIESVRQKTLNMMAKGTKIKDIEEKIKLVRRYNISIMPNFIIGFPWDTEKDYIAIMDFIKRNGLQNYGKVNYLAPLPGTKLWKECLKMGQIKDEWEFIQRFGNLFFERSINLTNLPDETLDYYYEEITKLLRRPVIYPKSKKYLNKLGVMY